MSVVQPSLGKVWPWYRSTCCRTSVAWTSVGLAAELSGDFVPGCGQTMHSVGRLGLEAGMVVDSRELLGPDATLFHGEIFESPTHGRERSVWIVPVHPD